MLCALSLRPYYRRTIRPVAVSIRLYHISAKKTMQQLPTHGRHLPSKFNLLSNLARSVLVSETVVYIGEPDGPVVAGVWRCICTVGAPCGAVAAMFTVWHYTPRLSGRTCRRSTWFLQSHYILLRVYSVSWAITLLPWLPNYFLPRIQPKLTDLIFCNT